MLSADWKKRPVFIGQSVSRISLFHMPISRTRWPPAAGAPSPPQQAAQGTVSAVAPKRRPVVVPLPSLTVSRSRALVPILAQAQLTWPHHLGFPFSAREGGGGHGSTSVCGLLLVKAFSLAPPFSCSVFMQMSLRVVLLHRELPSWFRVHELSGAGDSYVRFFICTRVPNCGCLIDTGNWRG